MVPVMYTVPSTQYPVLHLQFVGNTVNNAKAWSHIHEHYRKMIRNAWEKTRCMLTADGTDDDLVKPEGIADYAVPAQPAE